MINIIAPTLCHVCFSIFVVKSCLTLLSLVTHSGCVIGICGIYNTRLLQLVMSIGREGTTSWLCASEEVNLTFLHLLESVWHCLGVCGILAHTSTSGCLPWSTRNQLASYIRRHCAQQFVLVSDKPLYLQIVTRVASGNVIQDIFRQIDYECKLKLGF